MKREDTVVCVHCGAVNRLPGDKDGLKAKCGKCSRPLFTGVPADIDAAMFDRQLTKGSLPIVVDVWAPWCGPCRAMAPEYEKAAKALEPALRFVKLNSDANQQLSTRLGIRGIPTMIAFRSGLEIARQSGAMTAGQIVSWLNSHIR